MIRLINLLTIIGLALLLMGKHFDDLFMTIMGWNFIIVTVINIILVMFKIEKQFHHHRNLEEFL